jgi:Trypsin-like peptidase domain
MGRAVKICLAALALLLLPFSGIRNVSAQTQTSEGATGSPFHKLRSISGAAGHEDKSKFVMDDARSAFTAGKDTRVIVYFEWEGPLGQHHFEGLWKSPAGKIVLVSDFSFEAKTTHFSGYWTMLMADSTPSGEWSIEARIDGEAAGFHSFLVTGSPVAASPQPKTPQPLSAAEMYKTAMNATVIIEKIGASGDALSKSTGFWIGDGQILTSFGTIDGARSLRLRISDGTQRETDKVLAWNRWQDWAILRAPGTGPNLKRGPSEPVSVGDRCVFLEWIPAGAKITDGSITGKNSFQRAGERLLVASGATPESVGGALLNEFGEYVGLIGQDAAPGGGGLRILSLLNAVGGKVDITGLELTALAVPLSLLPADAGDKQPVALSELEAKGEFLAPVVKSHFVATASLSSYIAKDSDSPLAARDYREIFSRRDQKGSLYVNWLPSKRQKVTSEIRLFNLDNKMLVSSKPKELSLNPERFMATTWEIPVGNMPAGVYRVDLLLDSQTVWREFFRVTD